MLGEPAEAAQKLLDNAIALKGSGTFPWSDSEGANRRFETLWGINLTIIISKSRGERNPEAAQKLLDNAIAPKGSGTSSFLSLQVLEGPYALSCVIQESMSLKYEPTSAQKLLDNAIAPKGSGTSSSALLLSSLELRDTKVYEPQIRALLGTASHFCGSGCFVDCSQNPKL